MQEQVAFCDQIKAKDERQNIIDDDQQNSDQRQ
jgi:hypothetical protein